MTGAYPNVKIEWVRPENVNDAILLEMERTAEELISLPDPNLERIRPGLRQLLQPQNVKQQIIRDGERFILARVNGKVVGIMNFQEGQHKLLDYYTAILPDFQRLKLYARMTVAVVRYARENGITLLTRDLVTEASVAWHKKYAEKVSTKRGLADTVRIELFEHLKKGKKPHGILGARFHIKPKPRKKVRFPT